MSEHVEHAHSGPSYYAIFGALIALTLVTVGLSYMELDLRLGFIVALVVASVKATLVVLYFMHLKTEVKPMYIVVAVPLILAVILTLALIPDVALP